MGGAAVEDEALERAVVAMVAAASGDAPASLSAATVVVRPRSVVRRYRAAVHGRDVDLVVKEPRLVDGGPASPTPAGARPRLAPPPAPAIRYEAEHAALTLIAEDLAAAPDHRLGAIRVLGYLPERCAIVMEAFHDPTLRDVLYRHTLGGRRRRRPLRVAAEHAGVWLRRYHSLPPPATAQPRQHDRREVVELAGRMLEFLVARARGTGRADDAANLASRVGAVSSALERALPSALPVALGHGDFALRNLIVGPGARITAYDGWAYWMPPVYEDIATFVGSLRTAMPRVMTGGRWVSDDVVSRLESAFLRGYGPRDASREAIHAYELFLLLDRWGSVPGVERPAGRLAAIRADRMWAAYRAEMDRLLALLRG